MSDSLEDQVRALTDRVRALEDESHIRRLMAAMLAKADERGHADYAARLAAYYTEDGMWTSGSGFADVAMAERGRDAVLAKFTAGTRIAESSHILGSESITVDGDEAGGTWLCFEPASLETEDGGQEAVWVLGRYHCEFRREGGGDHAGWKVRTVRFDGIFCTPFDKGWTEERFTSVSPLGKPG